MERSDHLLSSPGLYCRLAVTRGRFCCLRQSFAVIMTKVATVFNFDNIVQQYASRVLSVFKHLHTLNSRQAISPRMVGGRRREVLSRGLVVRAPNSRPEGLGSMPLPPNTLQVHTEYMLIKSVGPKVSWAESQVQELEKISISVPCLNCGGGDRW
ncbi:hypothetical protein TNCV_2314021 [Trichonephila clavipes]|nr:hypothetical protein TNCV_2314021 [Trichonephila clavipes]